MRPIDADALIELINGGYDLDFDEVPETKRELLRMIMEQPTVDAVPVAWIKERRMREFVKIYCCGDCIHYKKHRCFLGANVEGKPTEHFYRDCPMGICIEETAERKEE